MSDLQKMLANWAGINSALYCLCIFTAGMYFNNPWAWKMAIATLGICFLSYSLQMWYGNTMLVKIVVLVSISTGTIAGLSLLR